MTTIDVPLVGVALLAVGAVIAVIGLVFAIHRMEKLEQAVIDATQHGASGPARSERRDNPQWMEWTDEARAKCFRVRVTPAWMKTASREKLELLQHGHRCIKEALKP